MKRIRDNVHAVIFDWDGIVINSEPLHGESWQELGKELGREITGQQFINGFGMKNERFIKEVLGWADSDEEIQSVIHQKEQRYQRLVKEKGIPKIEGVVEFLKVLKEQKIQTAVATSTLRSNLVLVLELLELSDYFSVFVAAEDVQGGKPDPEVFLVAAERLDVDPSKCLVLEDAPAGVQAANAAKMMSLALTTSHSKEALSHATIVLSGYAELLEVW